MQKMTGLILKETISDGTAIIISVANQPIPLTVWVKLGAADIAAGTGITVSYSLDNGAHYTTIAVVISSEWEDTLVSGATNLKFQRTAGTGITSTCGVC